MQAASLHHHRESLPVLADSPARTGFETPCRKRTGVAGVRRSPQQSRIRDAADLARDGIREAREEDGHADRDSRRGIRADAAARLILRTHQRTTSRGPLPRQEVQEGHTFYGCPSCTSSFVDGQARALTVTRFDRTRLTRKASAPARISVSHRRRLSRSCVSADAGLLAFAVAPFSPEGASFSSAPPHGLRPHQWGATRVQDGQSLLHA